MPGSRDWILVIYSFLDFDATRRQRRPELSYEGFIAYAMACRPT